MARRGEQVGRGGVREAVDFDVLDPKRRVGVDLRAELVAQRELAAGPTLGEVGIIAARRVTRDAQAERLVERVGVMS